MSHSIKCPKCQTSIEITEVMSTQIELEIRAKLDADLASKRAELEETAAQLEKERLSVTVAYEAIDEQIRAGIETRQDALVAVARTKAREDLCVEIEDRNRCVAELQEKLKESQAKELELRWRERELHAQKEQLQLEVARQLDAERENLRNEAKRQFEDQHLLRDLEKEKQIGDLRKQIDDLKRRAEQGSQKLQGEVQELVLQDVLSTSFPADSIEAVANGIFGGDVLQSVLDGTGLNCGRILWESKRTKNWGHGWLSKARDDQRAARAACVVIVSEALPDGVRAFALVNGVWVCSWSCVVGLAAALRIGLIDVCKSKLAIQGQHEKMELVYNYLSGQEFRNRVAGIVEAFVTMHQDLESEKRTAQRIWSKREKQLERALTNTACMYGNLQGIIGSVLPVIDGLGEPRLEAEATMTDASELLAG